MSQSQDKLGRSLLVLLSIFLVMLLLNHWMPLHRDDYDYSLIWMTSEHIASVQDTVYSAYRHYLLHGGRMFTVLCLNFFLWLGKFAFDIANALMFTALVVLMYFHACRSVTWRREPLMLAVTGLFAWLSFPHFGEVAVWKSGSTVYLWSAVPVALFLLPYNITLAKGHAALGKWALLPMLLLGLIAGWSVENLAVTVLGLTAAISWHLHRQGKLLGWMPAGACGALLGLIGLVGAPGNFVRYDDQGAGKGILAHIGNQFAGNGEMLLYILPLVLLLLCAWRVFKLDLAKQKGEQPVHCSLQFGWRQWLMLGTILLLVVSYFNGSFVAWTVRDILYAGVMVPLGLTKQKTIDHFDNLFKGFDEMAIYWLTLFFVYALVKKQLGLTTPAIKMLTEKVKAREVWRTFPVVRYAGAMLALALLNNLVMIAAPTFPARATFSSVAMIIIAAVAVLRDPLIRGYFVAHGRTVLTAGALGLGAFTLSAALLVTYTMRQENDVRIVLVQKAAAQGESIAYMDPITMKNRALRHVFFVDFDNGVTKDGLCKYYGIKDIKVNPEK
ncbi:DUF6056 family protein [Selenomonas sp.]|uniref:DUF3329 domain-containing protein n=1 Tax=Selenomonas sp. TaxID=2053611 RepID=UPI0025EC6B17|nr:DUF6056 family protein [Selenomonas sp.]